MRTIEIEDDIYEHLRSHQTTFSGESASVLLRRLLKLGPVGPSPKTGRPLPLAIPKSPQETQDKLQQDEKKKELEDFLKTPQCKAARNATEKFLALLAFFYSQNPGGFGAVEKINGRSRKYFAKSKAELEQSGTSVYAKSIPNSEYWVVTNNSTQLKMVLLTRVMKTLGYEPTFALAEVLLCFATKSSIEAWTKVETTCAGNI